MPFVGLLHWHPTLYGGIGNKKEFKRRCVGAYSEEYVEAYQTSPLVAVLNTLGMFQTIKHEHGALGELDMWTPRIIFLFWLSILVAILWATLT